jgi:hypothetical protein
VFRRDLAVGGSFILLGSLIALHWMQAGKIVYEGDAFWLVDPWNYLKQQLLVWNSYASVTGRPRAGILLWPQLFLLSAISRIVGNSAGQMLAIGLMVGLGWAAMYAVLRLIRFRPLAAALGSAAYVLNPWTQVSLPAGWTILWCFTASTAIVAGLLAAAREPRYRLQCRIFLLLIWAVPTAVVATNLGMLGIEAVIGMLGVALAFSVAGDRAGYLRWAATTWGLMLLVGLWWLEPIASMFAFATPTAVGASGASTAWTVGRASFDNVLRFVPFWTWGIPNYLTYSRDYDANPLTYASSYTLVVLGVLALVYRLPGRAKLVRVAVALALVTLFLSKGTHEPLGWLNALLYRLPGTVVWREPTTKFPLIALMGLAICVSAFFEKLFAVRPGLLWKRAVAVAFAACFVVSSEALFTAKVFSEATLGQPSSYVSIPQYWLDAAQWLNAQPSNDAVLTLPSDPSYQVNYTWGLHATDILPSDLFHRHTVILGNLDYVTSQLDDELTDLVEQSMSRREVNLVPLLRSLGVRYVLFRGDVSQDGYVVMSLDDVRRRLPGATEHEFAYLTIFDIGPAVAPVEADSDWVAGNYGAASVDPQYELAGLTENAPRVDVRELSTHAPAKQPAVYEIDASEIGTTFPGKDQALRAVAGAKLRYVWMPPTRRFHTLLDNRSPLMVAVRDNDDRASSPVSTLSVQARLLEPPQKTEAIDRLSLIGLEESDTKHTIWSVVNPSDADVIADVKLAVLPRKPTSYVLSLGERAYIDTLGAGDNVVWAHFDNVAFRPGLNQLRVNPSPAAGGRRGDGSPSLLIGAIETRITRDSMEAGGNQNGGAVLDADAARHASFGVLALGIPLRDEPLISIDDAVTEPSYQLGGSITYESGGQTYRCYTPVDGSFHLHILSAILGCADLAGVVPGTNFVDSTTVDRVDLEAMILPGIQRIAVSPTFRSVSAAWKGGFTSELLTPVKISTSGLRGPIVPSPDTFSYDVFLNQPAADSEDISGDLVGASATVKTSTAETAGVVTSDTPDTLELETRSGELQSISKSSIVSVVFDTAAPRVTISFDPASIRRDGLLGIGLNGLPVRSAWLGHFAPGNGFFVRNLDLTSMFLSGGSPNNLLLRASDLLRLAGPRSGSTVAFRFALSDPGGGKSQVTLNARVISQDHGIVRATVGSRTYAIQSGQPAYEVPQRSAGLTQVSVEDGTDGASLGVIGAPATSGVDMAPVTMNGMPALLGWVPANDTIVQLRQGFSGTWLALCVGRCWPLVPHYRDAAGWNDWYVFGDGFLFVTNLFVVMQMLAGLASSVTLMAIAVPRLRAAIRERPRQMVA